MDAMEIQPQDALRAGETTEQVETRALDTATFEPGDHLEQTGDFRQAEAIQTSLEAVITSLTQAGAEMVGTLPVPLPNPEQGGESPQAVLPEDSVAGRQAGMQEGPLEPSGGGEDDKEDITPINLPGPQSTAAEESGFTFTDKEPAGSVEIPLPGQVKEADGMVEVPLPGIADEIACDGSSKEPAYQIGHKEPGGTVEVPLPSPEAETGLKIDAPEAAGSAEIPLPGTAGETGFKTEVGAMPSPIPSPEQGGESLQAAVPEDSVAGRSAGIIDDVLEPPRGEEEDMDNIIPINLPGPQSTAAEESGFTFVDKEPAGSTEIPLPGTTVETGWKLDDGELQVPLATPALEGLRMEEVTIDQIVARTQAVVEEMSEESDPEFLLLQQQMQLESQTYQMMSNIFKPISDPPYDPFANIR